MRSLLLLLVILVWLVLGWIYSSGQQVLLNTNSTAEETENTDNDPIEEADLSDGLTAERSESSVPIRLNAKKEQIELTDEWTNYKKDLLASLKEDEILQITGKYTEDELYSGSFENLGVARAEEIRQNLDLAPDKVQLRGVLDDQLSDSETTFEVISFRNIIVNNSIDESIENRTIIRFPSNSTNKLNDEVVEEYLDKLVTRIMKTGERVKLTGFSDSDGSEEDNILLGQRRADVIKNYLVSNGVNETKVVTLSEGERNPIASNEAEEGKAQNRRTELEIID